MIITRLAVINDVKAITDISQSYEPLNKENYIKVFMEEIKENYSKDSIQKIFVAEIDGKIVAHAKLLFYDPERLEVTFPSPTGWYFNGIIVKEDYRNMGIATKLSKSRENYIKENSKSHKIYSIVSSTNKISILYHKSLNFKEIKRAEGFLNIKLKSGEGILFLKEIN
jgi:RimJ/RimL family protein N-acetyltransferase